MNKWGDTSRAKLSRVHPSIVRVLNEVLPMQDMSVIYGARTIEEQEKLVADGLSKTMNSKHLVNPVTGKSHAVDVAPYPLLLK